MNKMKIIVPSLTLIGVFFLVFIVTTQILGVPLWWVFRGVVPMSGVALNSKFDITVNPEAPTIIGEKVTIIVRNATDQSPIENATVSVSKDANNDEYYTDYSGTVQITYLGEVTVIRVSKSGFDNAVEAIPQIPDKWVRETNLSLVSGAIPSVICTLITIFVQFKLSQRKLPRKSRK